MYKTTINGYDVKSVIDHLLENPISSLDFERRVRDAQYLVTRFADIDSEAYEELCAKHEEAIVALGEFSLKLDDKLCELRKIAYRIIEAED